MTNRKNSSRRKLENRGCSRTKPALAPTIEQVPLGSIDPAPYNPSRPIRPGEEGFERLRAAIETFGAVQLLVWNRRTGHLVGGHQTLTVMRHLEPGLEAVSCSVVDLPLELEKALNVRLNRRATSDDPLRLGELLQDLVESDIDRQLTGLDEAELNQAIAEMEAELAGRAEPLEDGAGDGETDGGKSEREAGQEKLASSFQVVAECDSEAHQREVYELLGKAGIRCRVLTLY